MGREESGVAARPGEVARLVDGGEDVRPALALREVLRDGAAVVGEAQGELPVEGVGVRRVAVVEKVVDERDPGLAGGVYNGIEGGEVVPTVAEIDHRPTDRLASDADSGLAQEAIVLPRARLVVGGADHVDGLAQSVITRGALEPAPEEGAEH